MPLTAIRRTIHNCTAATITPQTHTSILNRLGSPLPRVHFDNHAPQLQPKAASKPNTRHRRNAIYKLHRRIEVCKENGEYELLAILDTDEPEDIRIKKFTQAFIAKQREWQKYWIQNHTPVNKFGLFPPPPSAAISGDKTTPPLPVHCGTLYPTAQDTKRGRTRNPPPLTVRTVNVPPFPATNAKQHNFRPKAHERTLRTTRITSGQTLRSHLQID